MSEDNKNAKVIPLHGRTHPPVKDLFYACVQGTQTIGRHSFLKVEFAGGILRDTYALPENILTFSEFRGVPPQEGEWIQFAARNATPDEAPLCFGCQVMTYLCRPPAMKP